MANPNPKTGHVKKWKPGQSGNPEGGRLHNPMYRALKRATQQDIANIMNWVADKSLPELQAEAQKAEAPALQQLVAKCFAEAIKKGNTKSMNDLFTWMVGPMKQVVELKNPDGESFRTTQLTKAQAAAELEALRKKREQREGQ